MTLPQVTGHIESPQNQRVKDWADLNNKNTREQMGLLLLESKNLLQVALEAGLFVQTVLVQEKNLSPMQQLLLKYHWQGELLTASDRVLSKLASTATAPPVLAVANLPAQPEFKSLCQQVISTQGILLVLDGLQDPGNVGTLIRSAAAFGVSGLLIIQPACDVYSPKVLRASAGYGLTMPVVTVNHPTEKVLDQLQQAGMAIWLATGHPQQASHYQKATYQRPLALVLGQEGQGIRLCDQAQTAFGQLTIPMQAGVESLNVGVCGSILMAHLASQQLL